MSEDLERTIGAILATQESLKLRMARMESAFVKVGVGAVTLIVVYLLKQAGLI